MTERNRVVWSEGLFLRTQHFQQQDRFVEALMRAGLRASAWQSFGFSKLVLDKAALDAGQIAIAQAEGLFPDGTAFAIPADMPAPKPVAIKSGSGGGLVMLAIPMEQAGVPTIDPAHAAASGARFVGTRYSAADTVRNGAAAEDIEVASLAALLVAPGDSVAGYASLPIARVEGLRADGAVAMSDGYLPPLLTIGGSDWYAGLLREVVTGLERIIEAHGALVLGGAGRSVENLLILELANAARPKLSHLLHQNLEHPCALYAELAELAGRMATYGSSSRKLSELPPYDHADPQAAFAALADALRSMLLSLRHVEPKSRALAVAKHSQNVWKVRIDNPDLLKNSRIVLRIGSELSDESLRKIFVDQATVGAADAFEKLWKSRLPGIGLKPLHSQPREIPYDGERLCLELDQKSEHFASLLEAPGFVIGVSGVLQQEPQIDCYVVSR